MVKLKTLNRTKIRRKNRMRIRWTKDSAMLESRMRMRWIKDRIVRSRIMETIIKRKICSSRLIRKQEKMMISRLKMTLRTRRIRGIWEKMITKRLRMEREKRIAICSQERRWTRWRWKRKNKRIWIKIQVWEIEMMKEWR